MGTQPFDFSAGDSLLITADVPTVSQITRASIAAPHYSLVLELDAAVISDVAGQMKAVQEASHDPVRVYLTHAEMADAALRLVRLLDHPKDTISDLLEEAVKDGLVIDTPPGMPSIASMFRAMRNDWAHGSIHVHSSAKTLRLLDSCASLINEALASE